jgi:predicted dehydrogenase
MVTYHPQWHKVRDLIASGAIGTLRQVDAAFTYYNVDPDNMRNRPELGGGVIPDIGVYPTVTTRFATAMEPLRLHATVDFDPNFGTDRYASVKADFGELRAELLLLHPDGGCASSMVFHGEAGYIEVTAPFNAGDYGHPTVTLHKPRP